LDLKKSDEKKKGKERFPLSRVFCIKREEREKREGPAVPGGRTRGERKGDPFGQLQKGKLRLTGRRRNPDMLQGGGGLARKGGSSRREDDRRQEREDVALKPYMVVFLRSIKGSRGEGGRRKKGRGYGPGGKKDRFSPESSDEKK